MATTPVWLITGSSQGLGLAMVKKLLGQGFHVAAATRNKDLLINNLKKDEIKFNESQILTVNVDITDNDQVKQCAKKIKDKFGRIDVVVNNVGHGCVGAVEEFSDKEIKEIFNVNVFGMLNVLRHTIPYLRENKDGGRIYNLSSIVGYYACLPLGAIHSSYKFAIDGISEGLASELKEFNIKVTSVKPGNHRTQVLDHFLLPKLLLPEYKTEGVYNTLKSQSGKQVGSPDKLAQVLIDLSKSDDPPIHLFLGQDSLNLQAKKSKLIQTEIDKFLDLSKSTKF
ncbi:hypothetical protein CYY_005837 [Polysphondylium violaceum]|uniref:Short-chain dehydrogenase/reductase (SDR) family protein n=1 Tax=Polysphondylium violaceum TaxID=133409 RepID=A0A8J4PTM5_9MYCE|nr:hypothetical protein CYY_005837 [Polysphondylium violaceum]